MKLFDDTPLYSGLHDKIFNILLPMLVNEGHNIEHVISRTAYELGISYEEYLKNFLYHSEWPSPKSIIEKYNNLKNI